MSGQNWILSSDSRFVVKSLLRDGRFPSECAIGLAHHYLWQWQLSLDFNQPAESRRAAEQEAVNAYLAAMSEFSAQFRLTGESVECSL